VPLLALLWEIGRFCFQRVRKPSTLQGSRSPAEAEDIATR